MTTFAMNKADIRTKVKSISTSQMEENWEWGLEPYGRSRMAPFVSWPNTLLLLASDMLFVGLPTHTS